ncbi:MAG: RIO1 family regulatory kinase/ATPase, partial [Candidatus Bathyarchaeia archaeon]
KMKMDALGLAVSLERLFEEPFASIVCYPRASSVEIRKRLRELVRLGVTALEFNGEKQAFNVPILGKGCVGIVVIAHRNDEKLAMKIRRVDADRSMMQRESEMLKMANSVGVGPRLLGVSKNFLLMQFIDGALLPKWLERCRGKMRLKKVLREILEQCWRLDEVGLDHGELSHAPKHIIITNENEPIIVDFESSSIHRKPSNLTSICQFLFIGSEVSKSISKILRIDKSALIKALRNYKANRSQESFFKLMNVCNLDF